ncbi:hypothetical protein M9458_005364, partial [Cirrhinus mrigala]
ADLRELREVRAEVRELVQVAQSLRADLDQARGQNRSPVQPTASQFCSPPGKPHDSTPLEEDVNSAELPPPWPEPHVDLMNQVGDLALSDTGATIYQPVMPETRKYSFVCPAIQPLPPQLDAPDAFGLPPPPTPKELRELLTSVARPLPADRTSVPVSPRFSSVPATSNPPGFALKAEPGLRPVAPYSGSEYVYRGPAPMIPKFSRPDPGEFACLRIALKNLLPPDGTELFKYQILVDHLKFEEARMNSPTPFTDTMAALHDKFGQLHQLALRKIAGVLESPDIKRGDISAFQKFALQVQTLGCDGELELSCGSHVARLLNKLPPEQRAEFRRHMFRQPGTAPNLVDLSNWLRYETCRCLRAHMQDSGKRAVTILHGVGESSVGTSVPRKGPVSQTKPAKTEHYLSQCVSFAKLTADQAHHAAHCDLKKPCNLCQGIHLRPLHEVNVSPSPREDSTNTEKSCLTNSSPDRLFLDKSSVKGRVMLKVVPVNLHYEDRTLDTFALLDDGSERTILLSTAVKALGIQGVPEDLPLRTVRDDIQVIQGCSISFHISPLCKPQTSYKINHAFTADLLNLHLRGLPIRTLTDVQPLLLIGSDQPHLITPTEPIRWDSRGAPAAVQMRLGWTLQGPIPSMGCPPGPRQCLLTSMAPIQDELLQNWEGKEEALKLLDQKTLILDMEGIHRLATPLLRRKDMPLLKAPKESVLPTLRSVERRLLKDPLKAEVYEEEMRKLIKTGAVREVTDFEPDSPECWYIPHHLVSHNGKCRLVFNCSYQYYGQSLNQYLLPGPTLGASLLGVLIRFREHPVAVSGDIKAMFHQVRLIPEDRPLLRFLWRDLKMDEAPKILEWQVLPFGTTSSPCCATYALQRHVRQYPLTDEAIRYSVERCFYVDNCLQSLPTADEARSLIDRLRNILSAGGFEIRQLVWMELPMSRCMEQWLISGLPTRKVRPTCPSLSHTPVSLLNELTPFQDWNSAEV